MNNPIPQKTKYVEKAWGYELWIHNTKAYCGKLLVFKKDAKSSMHYHIEKEETWYVAQGEFKYKWIDTNTAQEHKQRLKRGDVIHLLPGQPHQLKALTKDATIFEVSTEHFEHDSYRVKPGDSQK